MNTEGRDLGSAEALRQRALAVLDPVSTGHATDSAQPAPRSDFDLDASPIGAPSPLGSPSPLGARSRMSDPSRLSALSGVAVRHAAVLVPIIAREPHMTVLLTQRTADMPSHAGQIAFPGGKMEPNETPVETALRETREEIGLDAAHVEILGQLDHYQTGTGFRIVPVVALVTPGFTLELCVREVADAFEVPLAFLLDRANHHRHSRIFNGQTRHFYAMPFGQHYIWGATAGMIRSLQERLTG